MFADEEFQKFPLSQKLKKIYDAPQEKEIIYCESGGIENLDNFPSDKSIILTVFPYKTPELFSKHLGQFDNFITTCKETKRIIPVIQSPLYYEKLDHFDSFFNDLKPPCYFVRGQFAYAALLGDDNPQLVSNDIGGTSLVKISSLMQSCEENHAEWLKQVVRDSNCWESRYRRIGAVSVESSERIKESMKYRYASVAYCMGEDIVRELIETFDHVTSSKILLHLHILFDHVICHGFGSHFCAELGSDGGQDFISSKFNVMREVERNLCKEVMLFPKERDEYFNDLLKYEHPLQGITLENLEEDNLAEVRSRILSQFENFRKKVDRLERKKQLAKRVYSISLFLLGAALSKINPEVGLGVGASGLELKNFKAPEWLYKSTFGALKRLYKHNLAFYLLDSKWDGK